MGGMQTVAIEEIGCLYSYLIQHETMHALGFWHEHQRPDRNTYIKINWDNIIPCK